MQIRGNRFVTEGTTFLDLFKYAYNIHPDQLVGGPQWVRTQKFDVMADPETEKRPTSDQMKSMVQQLLVQRFTVSMHHEQRVLPVYALLKADKTTKLTTTASPTEGIPAVAYNGHGELHVGNATMTNLATFFQRFVLDRPVVNQTNIEGRYDLVLRWTPDLPNPGAVSTADSTAPPGLFTAIQGQLGLKLKATKAAVDVFVIDQIAQPTPN